MQFKQKKIIELLTKSITKQFAFNLNLFYLTPLLTSF